jgi:hypothetical protein
MRKGLVLLATAATLGAAAIASPASAQYYGDGGYHHGWDRGGHWDHHDRDGRGDDWRSERAREWRWHHRDDGYYRSSYDRSYYRGGYGYGY